MTTKKSYFSLIEALLAANVVCIDFETQSDSTGKQGNMEYWHPHSRTTAGSFTVEDWGTWVVPLSHPQGPWAKDEKWRRLLTNLMRAMQKSQAKWIAHNAKYEVSWAYAMTGIPLESTMWWDTMMSSYILDENETHGLKAVAQRELGVDSWDEVNLKDSEKESWDKLALYNARDTDYCYRLVEVHKQRLLAEPRLARLYHFLGMPITRTLAQIERTGLPLDQAKVAVRKKNSEEIVESVSAKLLAHATEQMGLDLDDYPTISFGGASKFFKAFMEESGMPVISMTPKGAPSWTEDNLEESGKQFDLMEIEGENLASDIMLVRKNANKLSKFFVPWTKKLAPDGRLHPTYNPMRTEDKWQSAKGTKTGRLSSSNPNAQQIARDEKECFGGEEGWLVAELDYSQIELRILAWLSGSMQVLESYRNGEDLHSNMAARILDTTVANLQPGDRQKGKAGNFGFSYGMWEEKYVSYAYNDYGVRVTLEEARTTRREFFTYWDGLENYHDRQGKLAKKNGFVRNPLGRKRRLPEIHDPQQYIVRQAQRRAINAPTQSFASDLMCLSLIEIARVMPSDEFRLIGTVHDSLLAQVRPECVDTHIPRAAAIMLDPGTERRFGVKVGVPLAVDSKVGYHWNDPDSTVRVFQ